jgi:hypothetical protein
MDALDLTKRDMTILYGDRTFMLRAFRHQGAWHGSVVENRIPLHARFEPTTSAAAYFAAAVGFIGAMVDAGVDSVESDA